MEQLKQVLISFFKNRGANVSQQGEFVKVENVDQDFESKYGKKSPYLVSFDTKSQDGFYQGSKLFKIVMSLLKKTANTTILKINFDIDPLEKIQEKISLKNCFLKKIKKDYENNFFSRFTFNTTIRWLNKKEEINSEIFIHDNKVINGDLQDYAISSGELDQIDTKFMEKDYSIAKQDVKNKIKPKLDNISEEISFLLQKEIQRVKSHYDVQKKEFFDILDRNKKKLQELENEDLTTSVQQRISRIRDFISSENVSETLKKIENEMNFSIQAERQKHTIDLNTKLANTTVLYYPIYKLTLSLQDRDINKDFQLDYDPLLGEIKGNECFSCNQKMKDLALCQSKHVCCPDCLFRCIGCGGLFCKKCLKDKCESCGGPVCSGCVVKCKGCKKVYCKQHIREDSYSKEFYCNNCMKFCCVCNQSFSEENLIKNGLNSYICFGCEAKKKKDKILKEIFD